MADNQSIRAISTDKAPGAVGPYSQGVAAGNLVFVSGQIHLNPETGELTGGSIQDKAHQVLRNVRAVLEAAGCTMGDVVKATVFLKDINDFVAVNEVYAQYFGGTFPARSAFQVGALPKGADVEIEAIAWKA